MIKFYGIEIVNDKTGEKYRPVYPFAELENRAVLVEFVELYEKELLDFYLNGWNYSFGTFVHEDRENDTKDRFRDSWFKKGVVVY